MNRLTNTAIRVEHYAYKEWADREKSKIIKGLTEILGSNPREMYEVLIQEIDVQEKDEGN